MEKTLRSNNAADNLFQQFIAIRDVIISATSSFRFQRFKSPEINGVWENCWDNAPQESFFDHMKDEIDLSSCKFFFDVKTTIDDWMDYYNDERCQWKFAK